MGNLERKTATLYQWSSFMEEITLPGATIVIRNKGRLGEREIVNAKKNEWKVKRDENERNTLTRHKKKMEKKWKKKYENEKKNEKGVKIIKEKCREERKEEREDQKN